MSGFCGSSHDDDEEGTMNIDDMLEADRIVRWALGVDPRAETIEQAAVRVRDAWKAGVEQPQGAADVACIILGTGEVWQRFFAARAAVRKFCKPVAAAPAAAEGGTDAR